MAGSFARYFANKIQTNVSRARVNVGGVYNGKCKLIVQNRKGMSSCRVRQLTVLLVLTS